MNPCQFFSENAASVRLNWKVCYFNRYIINWSDSLRSKNDTTNFVVTNSSGRKSFILTPNSTRFYSSIYLDRDNVGTLPIDDRWMWFNITALSKFIASISFKESSLSKTFHLIKPLNWIWNRPIERICEVKSQTFHLWNNLKWMASFQSPRNEFLWMRHSAGNL